MLLLRLPLALGETARRHQMRAARKQLDPTIRSNDTRDFHSLLRAKIVGQEEGVQAVVDLYQVFFARHNSPGPADGHLLVIGTTRAWKTTSFDTVAVDRF